MSPVAAADPVCLYLETTNRCNLLCTTCPRTYADLEPQADMSWELFTRIVDQVPNIARVVLHGVGEPMLVKDLPRMVRYLKDRGAYVLFNTNGTVLTAKKGRELAESGLDELRVSLDAADARTFLLIRGKDYFNRIVRNVRAFTEMQAREGLERPRVSLWLTGLKETIAQLPEFVRIAHDIGVKEVYLQRLVFCEDAPIGMATARPGPVRAPDAGGIAAPRGGARRRPPRSASASTPPAPPSPAKASRARPTRTPGRCAGGLGRSCTSPPTGGRCRAASRPSRRRATRTTRSAMPRSRPCAKSGTATPTGSSARRCSPTRRPSPAPAAGCAGASEHVMLLA